MPGVIDIRQDVAVDIANAQAIGKIFGAIGRAEQNRQKRFQIDRVMSDISNGIDPMTAVQNSRAAGPVPFSEGLAGVGQRFGRLLGGTPDAMEDLTESILMGKLQQSMKMSDPLYQAQIKATEALGTQRDAAATRTVTKPPSVDQQRWDMLSDEDKATAAKVMNKLMPPAEAVKPPSVDQQMWDALSLEEQQGAAKVHGGLTAKADTTANIASRENIAANSLAAQKAKPNILTGGDGTKWSLDTATGKATKIEDIPGKPQSNTQTSAQDKLVAAKMDILLQKQGMALTNPDKTDGDAQWLKYQAEIDELSKYYDNVGKSSPSPSAPAATTPATPTTATGGTPAPTTGEKAPISVRPGLFEDLTGAQAAIKSGADPQAVYKRLMEHYADPNDVSTINQAWGIRSGSYSGGEPKFSPPVSVNLQSSDPINRGVVLSVDARRNGGEATVGQDWNGGQGVVLPVDAARSGWESGPANAGNSWSNSGGGVAGKKYEGYGPAGEIGGIIGVFPKHNEAGGIVGTGDPLVDAFIRTAEGQEMLRNSGKNPRGRQIDDLIKTEGKRRLEQMLKAR